MPEASPFWQNAFLVWAIVCIGWSMWSGWRAGVVRCAISLGGIVLAYFVFVGVAAAAPALIGWLFPMPALVIGVITGLAAATLSFLAIWFFGALLFKRTEQQESGVVRFFYGLGGAVLGGFFGLTLLWAALMAVRGIGGLSEGRFTEAAAKAGLPQPGAIERVAVKMKRSVEAGETGAFVTSIDILPDGFYRILEKTGRLLVNPAAMNRFLELPGIMEIVSDSKVVALTSDPEINDAARERRIVALMRNQKVIDAINDPGLIEKVKKIDLEKTLNQALAEPGPVGTPR